MYCLFSEKKKCVGRTWAQAFLYLFVLLAWHYSVDIRYFMDELKTDRQLHVFLVYPITIMI